MSLLQKFKQYAYATKTPRHQEPQKAYIV